MNANKLLKDGNTRIEVKMEDETVWLTQERIVVLFGKGGGAAVEMLEIPTYHSIWCNRRKNAKRYR